jgi:hypothetical protein
MKKRNISLWYRHWIGGKMIMNILQPAAVVVKRKVTFSIQLMAKRCFPQCGLG